jgi:hypothetical protein
MLPTPNFCPQDFAQLSYSGRSTGNRRVYACGKVGCVAGLWVCIDMAATARMGALLVALSAKLLTTAAPDITTEKVAVWAVTVWR